MGKGVKSGKDPRVRFTRKILQDSLISLMKDRPIAAIGIKEICALAEVSRSTFYTYYSDVYNLLEEIEDHILGYFENGLNQYLAQENRHKKATAAMFQQSLQYIADNSGSLQVLLSENGDIGFQKKFFQKFIARAWQILQDKGGSPEDVRVQVGYSVFIVYGAIGLIQYWLKDNMRIPIPELAKMFVKLTTIN